MIFAFNMTLMRPEWKSEQHTRREIDGLKGNLWRGLNEDDEINR